MDEIQLRAVLPEEYEDTGSLTQRAYAEYARPGDRVWDNYFGMLADVGRRAVFATVLVWWPRSVSTDPWASSVTSLATLRCTLIWSCKPSGFHGR
jgi:hypothetical protein